MKFEGWLLDFQGSLPIILINMGSHISMARTYHLDNSIILVSFGVFLEIQNFASLTPYFYHAALFTMVQALHIQHKSSESLIRR